MRYALKSFSFGQIIGKGFSLYLDNIFVLLPISFIANLSILLPKIGFQMIIRDKILLFVFLLSLRILISSFISAISVEYISGKYLNRSKGLLETFRHLKPIFFPLFGMQIIVTVFVIIGSIMFLIPGMILYLTYALSTPVMVIEGHPPLMCLDRSKSLTSGYKWSLFMITGLVFLFAVVIYGVPSIFFPQVEFIQFIGDSLFGPLLPCFFILVYFKMRIDKEGFALEHLAHTFLFESDKPPCDTLLTRTDRKKEGTVESDFE